MKESDESNKIVDACRDTAKQIVYDGLWWTIDSDMMNTYMYTWMDENIAYMVNGRGGSSVYMTAKGFACFLPKKTQLYFHYG